MEGDNFPFFVGICAVIRVVLAVPYVLIAKYEAKYRGFAMWEVARVLAEGFCFTVPIFTSRSQVRSTDHVAVCVCGRTFSRRLGGVCVWLSCTVHLSAHDAVYRGVVSLCRYAGLLCWAVLSACAAVALRHSVTTFPPDTHSVLCW